MTVGAISSSSTSRTAGQTSLALPDQASLKADDNGQLTLKPLANGPVDVSRGADGRYHVSLNRQDIAFTPEQMGRLDIQAGEKNPLRMAPDVDIPVKVNGQLHGPGGPLAAGGAPGKGFDSVPGVAGDAYVPPEGKATGGRTDARGLHAAQQLQDVERADASRAAAGNNWDSVGVPERPASAEQVKDGAEAKVGEKGEKGQKADKSEKEKKGKSVQVCNAPTNGPDHVKAEDFGDMARITIYKNEMDIVNKVMTNMLPAARESIELVDMRNKAEGAVAGMRAEGLAQMLSDVRERQDRPNEVGGMAGGDNRDRR
jgi:hypothetical protein